MNLDELYHYTLKDIQGCQKLEYLPLVWKEIAYFQHLARKQKDIHKLGKLIDEILNKRENFYVKRKK